MKAGFGKADITPEGDFFFGRLGFSVKAEGVHMPLFARLALFDDGASQNGILVIDIGLLYDWVVGELRAVLNSATGIPAGNFLLAATHTHNAPAGLSWHDEENEFKYFDFLKEKLMRLAKETKSKMREARIGYSEVDASGYSFNRRPMYKLENGDVYVGTHGARDGKDYIGQEGADEKALGVLSAFDTEGSLLGGIVNFACHPTNTYGSRKLSPDFPGFLLKSLEDEAGGCFVFANGPCGNLSNSSGIPERKGKESGEEYCEKMGQGLADVSLLAIERNEPIECKTLENRSVFLDIPQRRISKRQLEAAKSFLEAEDKESLLESFAKEIWGYECHFYHRGLGISEWLAKDLLGMREWQARAGGRELIESLEIQCFSFGSSLAIVGIPGELFKELGDEIKKKSPFENTMIIELANGWHSYIPHKKAFEHGGYECCSSFISRLVPEAGDIIVENSLKLLKEMKEEIK